MGGSTDARFLIGERDTHSDLRPGRCRPTLTRSTSRSRSTIYGAARSAMQRPSAGSSPSARSSSGSAHRERHVGEPSSGCPRSRRATRSERPRCRISGGGREGFEPRPVISLFESTSPARLEDASSRSSHWLRVMPQTFIFGTVLAGFSAAIADTYVASWLTAGVRRLHRSRHTTDGRIRARARDFLPRHGRDRGGLTLAPVSARDACGVRLHLLDQGIDPGRLNRDATARSRCPRRSHVPKRARAASGFAPSDGARSGAATSH